MRFRLILVLVFFVGTVFSQSRKNKYNRFSIEVSGGLAKVFYPMTHSFSNKLMNSPSLNLGVRLMTNELFGFKANFNYNKFSFESKAFNIKDSNLYDHSFYYKTSLEGCVNIGNLLKIKSDKFGILANLGGGFSILQSDRTIKKVNWKGDGSDIMLNFSFGLTPMYKLNANTILTLNTSLISNLLQTFSFDTNSSALRQGFDGMLYNFGAGIILYFGKKEKHFDWIN